MQARDPKPTDLTRKHLNGRRATYGDMATRALELRRTGHTQRQIADVLGYSDPAQAALYVRLGEAWDGHRRRGLDEGFRVGVDEFSQNELVKKWAQNLNTRGRGGTPLASGRGIYRAFQVVSETLKISPAQWIAGDHATIIKNATEAMTRFMELYGQKKTTLTEHKGELVASVAKQYSKGVRDFLRFYSHDFPRNTKGVMSQSVEVSHGKYGNIRISRDQYAEAKELIKKTDGLDTDLFRWFSAGIESIARPRAFYGLKADYTVIKNDAGDDLFLMTIYESKTKHIKGGQWDKYIFSKDTQDAIAAAREAGSEFVIKDRRSFDAVSAAIYPKLKTLYAKIGLTKSPTSNEFPNMRPGHTLRHLGTQLWLELTNWDLSFISEMGWNDVREMTVSYGQMPAEIKARKIGAIRF